MQFYPADWKTDPDLRKCSLASRGFWIEMLGSMHLDNRSGEISGSFSELSQLAGCTPEEAQKAIKELHEKQAANVTLPLQNVTCNEKVTLINRRMKNEHKKRTGSTLRVRKHREQQDGNATVTVHSSEDIVQKTENTVLSKDNIVSLAASDSVKINYSEIALKWNETAANCGLSKIDLLTEKRKSKIKSRIAEKMDFEKVYQKITESDFLRGGNGHQWKVTFDWIIENAGNWVKITEGQYDNKERFESGNAKDFSL
jgi:hypothetical protein